MLFFLRFLASVRDTLPHVNSRLVRSAAPIDEKKKKFAPLEKIHCDLLLRFEVKAFTNVLKRALATAHVQKLHEGDPQTLIIVQERLALVDALPDARPKDCIYGIQ